MLQTKSTTAKGRGVFASEDIGESDIIEKCEFIVIPAKDFETIRQTEIINYCFYIDKDEKILGVALGFGSLYNHSYPCNAHHIIDKETRKMTVFALRDIAAGEEICINYNGDPDDGSEEWFLDRGISLKV